MSHVYILKVKDTFLFFSGNVSVAPTTMQIPTVEALVESEVTAADFQYIRKMHELLANIYLHVCPLPDVDQVVQAICDELPRVNYNGTQSLVHLFVLLTGQSPFFEKTANASLHIKSSSLGTAFGAGDEFNKAQCPIIAFITFVITQNKGLSHDVMVHLVDFVHGVILYNNVKADRVDAVAKLLNALDDFYFDLSNGKHGHSSCVWCVSQSSFVACIYHSFGLMEDKGMLEREKTDEASEDAILEFLTEQLHVCPGAAHNKADPEVSSTVSHSDDDDDDV